MHIFARAFAQRSCRAPQCTRALSTDAPAIRKQLRSLLRETAQPVAVVTALMDPDIPHKTSSSPRSRFHGATLSSFSSISMDPHPLVAFSLRIPSRMATSLTSAHTSASSPAHLVVNILSERQARTAVCFSRVDLYPEPFASVPHTLTEEGLPVLDESIGAMSCRLVAASWPLHDLETLAGETKEERAMWAGEGVASELFIAQVVRVERTSLPKGEEVRPLLYHRRTYATTVPIELDPGAKPLS
ncbi:flavin reductase like domain-containing protein [Ganoderma leucocontextum]|nr:flavin reductase like domain-containing protein [Ganoderma leucocontextum]